MNFKTVLDYRRSLEEQARIGLAVAARELEDRLATVRALEQDLDRFLEDLMRGNRQGLPASDGLMRYHFADHLAANLAAARREVEQVRIRKERHENALREAMRDCRVVETLDARRATEQGRRAVRAAQHLHDEAGIRRWREVAHVGTRDET